MTGFGDGGQIKVNPFQHTPRTTVAYETSLFVLKQPMLVLSWIFFRVSQSVEFAA